MREKKITSRILFIALISICLLAVAAPVRGDLASDPAINRMGLVRERSSVIGDQLSVNSEQSSTISFSVAERNTQYTIRTTQFPTPNPQSPIPNPQSAPRTVTYTYDAAGRLVLAGYGGGKTTAYTYDNAGNLLQRCALTADYNPDSNVDIAEIMAIARRWGAGTGDPLYDPAYDLNGDSVIDAGDVQGAAGQWRLCRR